MTVLHSSVASLFYGREVFQNQSVREMIDGCLLLCGADAFQKAKHRMIATRENLKADFIKTLGAIALAGHDDDNDTDA